MRGLPAPLAQVLISAFLQPRPFLLLRHSTSTSPFYLIFAGHLKRKGMPYAAKCAAWLVLWALLGLVLVSCAAAGPGSGSQYLDSVQFQMEGRNTIQKMLHNPVWCVLTRVCVCGQSLTSEEPSPELDIVLCPVL